MEMWMKEGSKGQSCIRLVLEKLKEGFLKRVSFPLGDFMRPLGGICFKGAKYIFTEGQRWI